MSSAALVVLCLTGGLACESAESAQGETSTYPGVARELEAGREMLSAADLQPLVADLEVRLPIDEQFSHGLPGPLDFAGPPLCVLAVADRADRAIHLLGSDGTYRNSVWAGGRDTSVLATTMSLSVSEEFNGIAASDLGRGGITVFGLDGRRLSRFVPERPVEEAGLGKAVALGPNGLVYDHWFAAPYSTKSTRWSEDVPLIRVFDSQGVASGAFGRVRRHPGEGLTAAINRGLIRLARDTLWFAYRSDARIFGFPLATAGTAGAARVVEPPLFYRMNAPSEYVRGTHLETALQEHLRAFATTPDGFFLLGQSVTWPESRDSLFRPSTALTILDPAGNWLASYKMENEIMYLAASSTRVFAVLLDRARNRRVLQVFSPPALAGAPEGC